jgi:hypothetical protein
MPVTTRLQQSIMSNLPGSILDRFRSPSPSAPSNNVDESDQDNSPSSSSSSRLDYLSSQLTQVIRVVEGLSISVANILTPPIISTNQAVPSTPPSTSSTSPSSLLVASSSPSVPTTVAVMLPPIEKPSKQPFPLFDGESGNFRDWRVRFLAVISVSELQPLWDESSNSLVKYGVFLEDGNFKKYDRQLFARLLTALPKSCSFVQSSEFNSRGLALWHTLLEDYDSSGGVHNTDVLMPAFYSISRDTHESVDAYWNRFQALVEDIQKDPSAPKLDRSHLRRHFLTTLGGDDFGFLKTDWENASLDPKWTRLSDAALKSELRVIQQVKSSSRSDTVAAHGYAHAVKLGTQFKTSADLHKTSVGNLVTPTDPSVQSTVPHMANIVSLLEDLTANSAKIEKRLEALEKPPKLSETPTKYCFTHGLNFSHTGNECERRCPDHKAEATNRNRMGGSNKVAKPRE